MASLGNPKVWVPYMNNRDCSQGFCSFYCPQWCYVIYPPPPPPSSFEFPKDDSSPNFSPLVIAIIGIFVSAFLLVSYYTLISKYCGQRQSSSQQTLHEENTTSLDENHNRSIHHEPWHVSTNGLDETLIKSITMVKYKKYDGLVELTDCSVCLCEFQDGESVRLLPKCNHAFHLHCIDTWLKSHSSCPLCRASIFTFNAATNTSVNLPVMEIPSRNEISMENQHFDDDVNDGIVRGDTELDCVEEVQKTEFRAFSDLGNLRGRDDVIEIREIQRSVSMDHCFQSGLLIADVLNMNEEEIDCDVEEVEGCSSSGIGSSKRSRGESSKCSYRRKVLHCVLSPISMKRSFSSGATNCRGRQGVLPI